MNQPIRLVSLGAAPAAGYEAPFEMLHACHERVHRMLRLLERLRGHVAAHGADEQARQAAHDIVRYFDQAAPQHHLDEERHVFPPLLATGDPATVAVVHRLQTDHRRMESDWTQARAVLQALAEGTLPALQEDQHGLLAGFAALYGDHIVAEEQVAYPAARDRLDDPALATMAQDMMARRGVTFRP